MSITVIANPADLLETPVRATSRRAKLKLVLKVPKAPGEGHLQAGEAETVHLTLIACRRSPWQYENHDRRVPQIYVHNYL